MFVIDDKLGLVISYDQKGMLIGHHIVSGRLIFTYEVSDEGEATQKTDIHTIDQSNNLNNVNRKKSVENVT